MVIKLFSCSTQLNVKFKMLISIKIQESQLFSGSNKLKMLIFLLINVKLPTIVGIFNIFEQEKFHAQLN